MQRTCLSMNRVRVPLWFLCAVAVCVCLGVSPPPLVAQGGREADNQDAGILLNFPENLELKVLVEYVSQRLGINILYDEQVGNRRVTIKTPASIPQDSLLGLLESALAMKGLALVDGDEPGWKRIVPAANLITIARGPKETQRLTDQGQLGANTAVTRVFPLHHTETKRADQLIKPFLTQPGGNSVSVDEHNVLIVTDYASNMDRLAGLIQLADQPFEEIGIEFVPVQHQEAGKLAQQVIKLIRAKIQAQSLQRGGGMIKPAVDVTHDDRTNQVIAVGERDRVADAVAILKSLDVSLGLETKVYQFKVASPERIDRLAKELIGPVDANRLYRSAVDQEMGFLVVTGTPQIHQKVESLKKDLDVPALDSQSPIRFYKLENASAADVLDTLSALEGSAALSGTQSDQPQGAGAGQPPSLFDQPGSERTAQDGDAARPSSLSVRSERAVMTADINTNSIIIVAKPEVHGIYESLIHKLDQRRPQVLVEITIVVLDTTDNFSLGVEISRDRTSGNTQTLTFSSFGLNFLDSMGVPMPGLGFNGAVISPDIADFVIRALKTDIRSKVVSAPRILVNDNATGTLESIDEQPFTSINTLNQGDTTTFGGFVEAGTSISVTPHISEGEHLSLEYTVSLNSFSGEGSDGIPPPRQTNSVESEVTVPDGNTVIVGGLNRTDYTNTVNAVPILGQIPIIKHLFSNETDNKSQSTLFVFIRPVILRDDKFEDLKFLSQRQVALAQLPGEYPASEPLIIE